MRNRFKSIDLFIIFSLSDKLLEKESLDLKDIIGVIGERPFPQKDNYKAYLSAKNMDIKQDDSSEQKED